MVNGKGYYKRGVMEKKGRMNGEGREGGSGQNSRPFCLLVEVPLNPSPPFPFPAISPLSIKGTHIVRGLGLAADNLVGNPSLSPLSFRPYGNVLLAFFFECKPKENVTGFAIRKNIWGGVQPQGPHLYRGCTARVTKCTGRGCRDWGSPSVQTRGRTA